MNRQVWWLARLAGAAAGAALLAPLGNPLVTAAGGAAGLSLPGRLERALRRHRARQRRAALAKALPLLARLAEAHRPPYQALAAAAPQLDPPLGPELQQALAEHQAGAPLDQALRALAARQDHDFYLHQLAEFTATALRRGTPLAGALERLVTRFRQAEELRAEAAAELFGYNWLTLGLFLFSLAPLPLARLTGGPQWAFITGTGTGKAILAWVVWSGLCVAALPGWLTADE